ncbi:hypothetical protein HK104_003659, partial [Borealophlyctis nickersoniae]
MLLLDDTGNLTHLTMLIIGPAHVGKTELIRAFVKSTPISALQSAANRRRSRGVYVGPYDPTIENSITLQYVLPNTTASLPRPPSPVNTVSSNETITTDPNAASIDRSRSRSWGPTEEELWQRRLGQRIILTIIDVGGHPFYGSIWASAIAAADAFMLVYDVGDRRSFDTMWNFYKIIVETKCARPTEIPIMMVGNMVDTVSSSITVPPPGTSGPGDPKNGGAVAVEKRPRAVTSQTGQSFADLLCLPFFETTVKAPQSVAHCFRSLVTLSQTKTRALVSGLLFPGESGSTSGNQARRPSDLSIAATVPGGAPVMTGSDKGGFHARFSQATKFAQASHTSFRASVEKVRGSVGRMGGEKMRDSGEKKRDSLKQQDSASTSSGASGPSSGAPPTAAPVDSSPAPGNTTSDSTLPDPGSSSGTPQSSEEKSVIKSPRRTQSQPSLDVAAKQRIEPPTDSPPSPPQPDSIRARRDAVFRAWKTFRKTTTANQQQQHPNTTPHPSVPRSHAGSLRSSS